MLPANVGICLFNSATGKLEALKTKQTGKTFPPGWSTGDIFMTFCCQKQATHILNPSQNTKQGILVYYMIFIETIP